MAVAKDEKAMFGEMDMEERMALVCNDQMYAEAYFGGAMSFLKRVPELTHGILGVLAAEREHSAAYDYDSIMNYDSYAGGFPNERPITRKDGVNGGSLWMGGGINGDLALTKVSAGDVARIAQLYPSGTEENKDAQNGVGWQTATEVKIRGVVVGVKEGSLRPRNEL